MDNLILREVNLKDENDISMYERALYRAFATDRRVESDQLRNYDHKQKRCSTKVPYTDQYVFVAQLKDKIVAAICGTVKVAGDDGKKTAEILHVFNNSGQIGANALQNMREILLKKCEAEGITQFNANCFNDRFGKDVGKITIENVKLS